MIVSLFLFCTPFVLPVHKHLPCLHPHTHIISLHGGHRPLPSKTETGRRSLFLTALVDWLHPQPCTVKKKKKQSLFSQCLHHPNLLAKIFFIGLAEQVCFSLCECVYITVHVWKNKMGSFFLFCVLVLFQCMLFYV